MYNFLRATVCSFCNKTGSNVVKKCSQPFCIWPDRSVYLKIKNRIAVNPFFQKIKDLFAREDSREWFDQLIEKADKQRQSQEVIPFAIDGIRSCGFVVRAAGLYAFCYFNHMPWRYPKNEHWEAVYPHLHGKRFQGRVFKVNRDPVGVYIDGKVEQFAPAPLKEGEYYTGVITGQLPYGVFIDIGYHFDWRYGSLTGLRHRNQFASEEEMADCMPGTLISVKLQGADPKGHLAFGRRNEHIDWKVGKAQKLVGEPTWALVKKSEQGGKTQYYIKGIYEACPLIDTNLYPKELLSRISGRLKKLSDYETIDCTVVRVDETRQKMYFKWEIEHEFELKEGETISNLVSHSTMSRLEEIKQKMAY